MVDKKQKGIQEKVMVYQILQNQLEEFTKQGTVLETRLNELDMTENSLKEMKNARTDSETLFSLGGGCYGHGKLVNKDKFMIDIGAGIMANKTLPEALSLIGARKKEMEDLTGKLQAEMEKVASTMNQIGIELQRLNEESAGKGSGGISIE